MKIKLDTQAIKTVSWVLPGKRMAAERPQLAAIHVFDANESRFYEASNGHIAIRIQTQIPDDSDPIPENGIAFLFPAEFFKNKSRAVSITLKKQNDIFFSENYIVKESELPYPNLGKIISEAEKQKPAEEFSMFRSKYLAIAEKVFGTEDLPRPLQNGYFEPAVWSKDDITVVIMPHRI